MRRLAVTLCALALLWTCAATVYLLLASTRTGIATPASLAAGGDEATRPPSLSTASGVWMAGLLMAVTLLSGLPLGVGLAHPPGQRTTAWAAALLLLAFCLASEFSVGLLYLPSAILLVLAGGVARVGSPGATPYAEP